MLETRTFYYLRHGETDWNRSGRSQGRNDVPLNETGRAQARAATELLAACGVATICCSPLSRARETAEIVNLRLGLSIVEIDALIECNWGVGEGQPQGDWYTMWRDGGHLEGAEPYADFIERALGGINEALTHPGPVLIAGHGGVYRAVKTYAQLDIDFKLANSIPVRHDPPSDAYPWWKATMIETKT